MDLSLPVRPLRRGAGYLDEFLLTNGLGGYALGNVAGAPARGYHALLVAARPGALGRVILLQHLAETVELPGGQRLAPSGLDRLSAPFAPEPWGDEVQAQGGLPVWPGFKRAVMEHGANRVLVRYEGPRPYRLRLRPWLNPRPQDSSVAQALPTLRAFETGAGELVIEREGRELVRLRAEGARFVPGEQRADDVRYSEELARGYPGVGPLWSPGELVLEVEPGRPRWFEAFAPGEGGAPAERVWQGELARRRALLEQAGAPEGARAELVLAADAFLVRPAYRGPEAAQRPTIIAGYPWFTDWGRDTMISLEGLCLCTGRHAEAREILRAFAGHVRDGLVPNLFPEGEAEGLYHTADATLWFFHALDRYRARTGDAALLAELRPVVERIIEHHLRGTRFGIGADPSDGLLRQGEAGYQLTWMDAKVGDHVVTPRRGKAVELNALWHNALVLAARWTGRGEWAALAARVRARFAERFWCAERGHLYDVIDGEAGDDPALRPNQLLALSLPNPVLDGERAASVLRAVRERLWTPFGLRTLDPAHPDYRGRIAGDLVTRDLAYHQGTVWPWLLGPWLDAELAANPSAAPALRAQLEPLLGHLGQAGLGSVSEIFDGDPPHLPRGCPAQAWSVAELLRGITHLG